MTADKAKQHQRLREAITIIGARSNNLKNVSLTIPKNKLVVVTGVSGSGKSTITMDTLFAEGQRRYVESLSSYARQFLMRMKKPEVDRIDGICPAIAIEQKVTTGNARSTVGTMTEIYDFLRLLYARIGKTISPLSGNEVKRHTVTDVVDYIFSAKEGTKVWLTIPIPTDYGDRTLDQELSLLLQKGYNRLYVNGELSYIEDALEDKNWDTSILLDEFTDKSKQILIDRFIVKHDDEENRKRIADSVQTAFYESKGECYIVLENSDQQAFNNRFELDGMLFPEPTPQLFNFNNPFGACPKCEGFSQVIGIDVNKVIPDPSLSVVEGAVFCWRGETYGKLKDNFLKVAHHHDFPIHRAYEDLTKAQQKLLWNGSKYFDGIHSFFEELESKLYKIQNRVMLARYRGRTICPSCDGARLRPEALYVKVGGKAIGELTNVPIDELEQFFNSLELSDYDQKVASRLLLEVTNRLDFLLNVGLGYLTLDRISSTLSGGETQRINLSRTLGSNLTNSLYILDEPSVGLHPRDTARLVSVLQRLRDLGNTVIVVEHEEEIIRSADYLIDIGPEAGIHGGEVVFAGPFDKILKEGAHSLTTKYLTGEMGIALPDRRRNFTSSIWVKGAAQHNLKHIDVQLPLNTLTVVSGVSGSGKTTLIKSILYPGLQRVLGENTAEAPGRHTEITGDLALIHQVELVNQSPIGKSSRSNPVTYVKAYDSIRDLMSNQQLSKIRGFKPKHFSFNVDGGRCDGCQGEGEQVVEMQFLADLRLTCEVCNGKRFKKEVLDVKYKGKSIFDILNMTIEEALEFFEEQKDIIKRIQPLFDVGLGYVQLGQSSSTLSGGEAQRVKLAAFLIQGKSDKPVFFIFDEPTTGLHFHDIQKLLTALNALVEIGHTVLVVEHNTEVIKSADWLVDLGPEGGKNGGFLVYQGVPEGILDVKSSLTGQFLQGRLKPT